MKSKIQIEREVKALSDYVNAFPRFLPLDKDQARGFELLEALEWVLGKHRKTNPSLVAVSKDSRRPAR